MAVSLAWDWKKTGKEHSPRDFHGSMGCHGAESTKAGIPSLSGCRAVLRNVCSSPYQEGTALSPSLCSKVFGTQFSSPAPLLDGEAEN